jgi:predicted metal-dependent hydrolase
MRDDKWLFQQLDEVWETFFPDMSQDNDVRIVWGRRARQRLGSISQDKTNAAGTLITINALFKDEKVPEFVVQSTIAHELAHYAHGFHSPIKRKFDKPHEGGVVHRELDDRGAKKLEQISKKWLKENWREYLEKHLPRTRNVQAKRRIIIKWI